MLNSNEILSSGIFDFKVFSFSENLLEAGTGNNGQQILLFLGGPDAETNRTFLGKVMTAVGVTIQEDSFTIPVPDSSPFLFANLASEKGCQTAIFFGIQPQQAGLHLSVAKYQPIKVGQQSFLFADSMDAIQNTPSLKRPLWEALKMLFGK